jgi:outer membrane protein assembly factor BamB
MAAGPVKWSYSTGATTLTAPGIRAGTAVYSVSNDRNLHAMNAGPTGGDWPTAAPAWTPLAMNGPSQARPPIVPVTIGGASRIALVGSQDGRVYCVNAMSGSTIWTSAALGSMVQAAPAGMFSAAPFNGTYDLVFAATRNATSDNRVYALNPTTGSAGAYPAFDNGGGLTGIGIISGGMSVDYPTNRLYFASRTRGGGTTDTLFALNIGAGAFTKAWSIPIGDVDSSPVPMGTTIYIGNNVSQVRSVRASDGFVNWTWTASPLDGAVKGFVSPDLGNSRLFFSTTTKVWNLKADGSGTNWSIATIPNPSTPLYIASLGMLYVGSSDGKLYEINVATQATKSVTLGDGLAAVGSPSLDTVNSLLHAGTTAGAVYAIGLPLP